LKKNILVKKTLPATIICDILNPSQENFVIEIKQTSWSNFFSKINIQIQSWSKKFARILQDIQSCPRSPLVPTIKDTEFRQYEKAGPK